MNTIEGEGPQKARRPWRMRGEITNRRELVGQVACMTLCVIVCADLIDLAVNLAIGSDRTLLSLVQTTFTAALMSTIFIGMIAKANLDLFRVKQRYQILSRTDAQTGLMNRRTFFETGAEEARRARCVLLVADIDSFKRINDVHGHPAGDAVIAGVGQAIAAHFPEKSLSARLGGEEFAVLVSGCGPAAARAEAELLCARIAAHSFDADGRPFSVTISVGIAPLDGWSLTHAYARADRALYFAKAQGRNRVATAAEADAWGQHPTSMAS